MSRKNQISIFAVIFLVFSNIFLISVDSSVKSNLSISKFDSGKGKTDVEIINFVNAEASSDYNDFFSKNSVYLFFSNGICFDHFAIIPGRSFYGIFEDMV